MGLPRYFPPSIDSPIPYPLVSNPRTGEPFTAPEIAALHRRITEATLTAAREVIAAETPAEVPAWAAIQEAAERFASCALFDALGVHQAGQEVA
jgi:hypothetical protein